MDFFDQIYKKMEFDIFDVFRDRHKLQIPTPLEQDDEFNIMLKSRNIKDDGFLESIDNYDAFIDENTLDNLTVGEFLDRDDTFNAEYDI